MPKHAPSRRLALLGLACGLGVGAHAAEVAGRLLSATHFAVDPGARRPLLQNTQLGFLRVRESFDEGPRFEGSVRLVAEPRGLDATGKTFEADFHEFYLNLRRGDWDVSLGRRIRSWGIADGVNPTRFFGAKDHTLLLSNETDKELPLTQLIVNWTPDGGAWTWGLVFLPTFVPDKFYVPPESLPTGVAFNDTAQFRGEGWGGGGGLRLAYVGDGFDFALVGFAGFDPRPEYEVRVVKVLPELVTLYRKQVGAGLEASTSTGPWIFRLEGSFRHFVSEWDRDPYLLQRTEGVVGVERSLGDSWRINAQAIGHHSSTSIASGSFPLTAETAGLYAVVRLNERVYRSRRSAEAGATFRLAYDSETNPFTAEVFGVTYFADLDWLGRGALGWKARDGLKLSLGVDYYSGDDETLFGSLHDLSAAWFEAAFDF